MKNSIKANLSFSLSIVIVVAGLIAGLAQYYYATHNAERELNVYINNETDEFANELSLHLWNFDNHTIELVCAQLLESREVIGVRVLGVKNRVVFEDGQFTGNNIFNTARNIYYKDNIVGHLEISATKEILWESKKNILITAFLVILCITITYIPIMQLLIRRFLVYPLQNLGKSIEHLTRGQYDVSFPSNQKAEIQGIIDSFSGLSLKLEVREKEINEKTKSLEQTNVTLEREISERKQVEKELTKYKDQLEALVDERTRELRNSQKKLISSERLAVLGKLSSGIAHEIRNPLATIGSSA